MPAKSIIRKPALMLIFATLLAVLAAELSFSIQRETQTWDEAAHIYAGYMYWTHGDFGMNPEHPPLVKLLAAAPLVNHSLSEPPVRGGYFKAWEFLTGHDFLYANNPDWILYRSRMAAALLTLLLGALIFAAGNEMFGAEAGLIALALFVSEPIVLAHGALVTTDAGFSLFLFATVYAFYRYVKQPSLPRLLTVAVAVGLGLATKHSGVLIFPILLLLALTEFLPLAGRGRDGVPVSERSWRLGGALVAIGVISVVVLWGFYGFRFSSRPAGETMTPALAGTMDQLQHPSEARILLSAARLKLLPEAYLYGLADVKEVADSSPSYLFGKVYAHGVWFYFPAAFVIKTSIALLLVLLAIPLALKFRQGRWGRELAFLAIPPVLYFGVAMGSKLNLGIRHVLPIYPFLFVLAGMAASSLIQHRRIWVYVVGMVLLFDVISSARAFPNYIPYANELWGGPGNTYKFLTDSNTDWGQQLKSVKRYLDRHSVKNCWFAYFADVVADPAYYGIPCKPLTTIASVWLQPKIDVPAEIDGPVLISAGVLSGYEFGPGELNPYAQFQNRRPSAIIDNGVFVFDGHFDVSLASALNHITKAQQFDAAGLPDRALAEVQLAAQLVPRSARVQAELGRRLLAANRSAEARIVLQNALSLAQNVEPAYQQSRVHDLQRTLADFAP